MKQICLSLILICLLQLQALASNSGSLIVDITGFKNDKGVVRLDLFDDATKYDKMNHENSGALRTLSAPISAGKAHLEIDDLTFGHYALRFFHDEDKSGKFYTNFIGIPKVEYGFSENARGRMGPAKYKAAEFVFDDNKKNLSLTVVGSK